MAKNVLLITADQLRHDAMSLYHPRGAAVPNLERLAARGAVFDRAYTPNPICVPARATITTGNYPHKCTGVKANSGRIKDGQPKIAGHFNGHGYMTYAIGKLHYVPYSPPDKPALVHGFQYYEIHESGRWIKQFDPRGEKGGLEAYADYLKDVGFGGYQRAHGMGNNEVYATVSLLPAEHYVDSWMASRTISVLDKHLKERGEQPFFCWMSSPKPHSPYDPPEPYHNKYKPWDMPEPVDPEPDWDQHDPVLKRMQPSYGWELLSPQGVLSSRARYWALMTFQDKVIGVVLDFLEERGVLDDTVVVYTADHGDLLGDHGCFFKSNFYEGSAHIPLIISASDIPQGVRRRQFAGLQDVLPTLADLTGTVIGREVDGISLRGCMADDKPTRDYYVIQCADDPWQGYSVVGERYKYMYRQVDGWEGLFDLEEDPGETMNLVVAGKQSDVAKEMRRYLIDWIKKYDDPQMLDKEGGLKTSDPPEEQRIGKYGIGHLGRRWF